MGIKKVKKMDKRKFSRIVSLLFIVSLLVGCSAPALSQTPIASTSTASPIPPTQTPITPTDSGIVENSPDISDYPIVETNQTKFFNNNGEISEPLKGDDFYGQDANYTSGVMPSYTDNGDGTITDNNTGLMWVKDAGL